MAATTGVDFWPYVYLGAKHMVTGYDHLAFLVGVIFFLYGMRHIALYVTLFSIGHSLTLLFGVLSGIHVSAHLVDAIIGLSVIWKALDNLGAFRTLFGWQPGQKAPVLIFGLFHGFGLATKLQEVNLSGDGLVANMLAFNIGVELGQILALTLVLALMTLWRATPSFNRHAMAANVVLAGVGLVLFQMQMVGFLQEISA
ncbi:HupE/UreJ family protein [Pseudoroseicyclus sp. CLL3-39]|uniref:HupE/UreJ family protein n=2 Tax=Pseudoroseicyclus tamaricis TaxID=2705421 RepID=A0A6B2K4N4_9RHOB|nr:HupE/UreJ family protein [Pseudoroseicyclus tamaricis]